MPSFAASEKGLANLWGKAELRRSDTSRALSAARKLIGRRARYEAVARKTGVPWWWVAAVHWRESTGSFAGVLHNGERILGTGRKTRLVPAGRGPFRTWEQAAIDALRLKRLHRIKDWSMPRALYEWERYNGFGYVWRGVNSPYLFGGTTLQQRGKFVADGKWSSSAWDKQLGCVAILKAMLAIDPTIRRPSAAPAPVAPIVTTAAASSAVLPVLAALGEQPMLVGAAAAALVILAAELRHTEGARKMLRFMLTNWKTNGAGLGALGYVFYLLVQMFVTGQVDATQLGEAVVALFVGFGLLSSKDADVTGGNKRNAD